jgi:cytochrome d ubiquinol oxidase subunit I
LAWLYGARRKHCGPLLGYEVLTAFFLEASFLGIMLFGKQRVSNRTHLLATFLVAFGTSLSAFWILALNSWMHTPAGYVIREGSSLPRAGRRLFSIRRSRTASPT